MRSGKVDRKKRTHALFVGFAPYDHPRYSIAVVVEHGIGGTGSALPVAARLLETALDLDAKKEKKTDEKDKPYLF
jgi:penicillin-binding protein 2